MYEQFQIEINPCYKFSMFCTGDHEVVYKSCQSRHITPVYRNHPLSANPGLPSAISTADTGHSNLRVRPEKPCFTQYARSARSEQRSAAHIWLWMIEPTSHPILQDAVNVSTSSVQWRKWITRPNQRYSITPSPSPCLPQPHTTREHQVQLF